MERRTIREGAHAGPAEDRRDLLTAGISIAASLLVVVSSWTVATKLYDSFGDGLSVTDNLMISVLLLNIALSMVGWRRYRALKAEVALRRAAEARASELATSDPLTGLLNRRAFVETGAQLIETAFKRGKAVAMLTSTISSRSTICMAISPVISCCARRRRRSPRRCPIMRSFRGSAVTSSPAPSPLIPPRPAWSIGSPTPSWRAWPSRSGSMRPKRLSVRRSA